MSFVVFYYIPFRKRDKGTCCVMLILSIFCAFLFSINIKNIKNKCDSKSIPDEIIELIRSENPKHLYNFYDYGGYLIYKDISTFVDGRADLYSPYNFSDYIKISNLNGKYEDAIKKYNFDYFLVSDEFPIYNYLEYSDDYKLIVHRNHVYFYKKIA